MNKMAHQLRVALQWRFRAINTYVRNDIAESCLRFRIWMADHKMGLTRNDRRLASFKNCHLGRRAFVIGNGPSLRISDLDLLKNEICFAANKIYLAFDETEWRPSYYFVSDVLVAKNNRKVIENLKLENQFFAASLSEIFGESHKNITYFPVSNKYPESTILKGVETGGTVIAPMLQFAYYMGFREIYLLGMDFSFEVSGLTGERTSSGDEILKSSGEINHFHPDYRTPGETWTFPKMDKQYDFFKRYNSFLCKQDGRVVVSNASRATKLDVFPRVNLSEIL